MYWDKNCYGGVGVFFSESWTSEKDKIRAKEVTNWEPDVTTTNLILELAGQHHL